MKATNKFFRNRCAVAFLSDSGRRSAVLIGMALLVFSSASLVWAQSGSIDDTKVGYLGQGNAGVTYVNPSLPNPPYNDGPPSVYQQYSVNVQNNACVPTSTANGLTYLADYALNNLALGNIFTVNPNTYPQVNDLASRQQTFNLTNNTNNDGGPFVDQGGTYTNYMFNGTRTWLNANNPAGNVTLSGQVASGTPASWIQGAYAANTNVQQNTTPTAAYLAGLLADKRSVVELTIEWGFYDEADVFQSQGGHEVVLTSLNVVNDSGFISFVDPWGLGNNAGSSGALITASVAVDDAGYLFVTYPIVVADSDHGAGEITVGADGSTGRIDVAMVETVPEPSAMILAAGALLTVLGIGHIRRRRAA